MKKTEIKRLAGIIADKMRDTENEDLYIISNNLIGFISNNGQKVIEKFISLQCDEIPHWNDTLVDVTPVYFSQSENIAHTPFSLLETESSEEALSVSGQEMQMEKKWFMPLFETIARQGNTSSKCMRMSQRMDYYLDKANGKQVTMGIVKLSISLLQKASNQFQENIDIVRNKLMFTQEMQLNFEGKKLELLQSEKRHLVPNIDNFFRMRKHYVFTYNNPLNWYFKIYKDSLKDIPHQEYQTRKHQREAQQAGATYIAIVNLMKDANDILEGNVKTAF